MKLGRPRRSLSFFLAVAIIFLPGVAVSTALAANYLGYCVNAILPGGSDLNARPFLVQVDSDSATLRLRSTIAREAVLTLTPEGQDPITATTPADKIQTFDLPDLTPGTTYRYLVERADRIWEGSFRTPAGADDTVRFGVVGSTGVGGDPLHAIVDEIVDDQPDFVLHTGDVVFPRGGLCHYGVRYFGPYEDLIGNVPVTAAVGEIDLKSNNGQAFRETFLIEGDPDQEAPLYRSFEYGPVHVIVLDSQLYEDDNQSAVDQQRAWLTDELGSSELPWTVVVLHDPPYSSTGGAQNDGIQEDLGPIFAEHGVDLVLSGHARNYERFEPDGGVTYVVTGGGGAGLQDIGDNRTSVAASVVHHFLSVEASPGELTVRVMDDAGGTIDMFTLSRD
ncbi:MAG: metallophosphoesterase [Thermomicrobiales bacterium]|nr:metallophosphoesterase [Thermomicrobiales bacterium]